MTRSGSHSLPLGRGLRVSVAALVVAALATPAIASVSAPAAPRIV